MGTANRLCHYGPSSTSKSDIAHHGALSTEPTLTIGSLSRQESSKTTPDPEKSVKPVSCLQQGFQVAEVDPQERSLERQPGAGSRPDVEDTTQKAPHVPAVSQPLLKPRQQVGNSSGL